MSASVSLSPDGRVAASLLGELLDVAWINRFKVRLCAWPRSIKLEMPTNSVLLAIAMSGVDGIRCVVSNRTETRLIRVDQSAQLSSAVVVSEPSSSAIILNEKLATVAPDGAIRDQWLERILPGIRPTLSIDAVSCGQAEAVAVLAPQGNGSLGLAVAGIDSVRGWFEVPDGTDEVVFVRQLDWPARAASVLTASNGLMTWHRVGSRRETIEMANG
jgi:hypothetical protein